MGRLPVVRFYSGKHLYIGLALTLLFLSIDYLLLSTLLVYNSPIGFLLLVFHLLIQAVVLLVILFITSTAISNAGGRRSLVALYLLITITGLLSIYYSANTGLNLDVPYTWVNAKAGLDLLNLKYLGGWSISFVFILTILFLLSDPRFTYSVGCDGKRHLYAHSKALGLLRLIRRDEKNWLGPCPDYPVISKETPSGLVSESSDWTVSKTQTKHWNDKVRVASYPWLTWTAIKLLFGLIFASYLSNSFAPSFVAIQTYLEKLGISWLTLFQQYAQLAFFRLFSYTVVPPSFPITNVLTFEFYQLLYQFIFWFVVIWAIRLAISIISEAVVGSKLRSLSNLFLILAIVLLLPTSSIPTWVFDARTPFYSIEILLIFLLATGLAVWLRLMEKHSALRKLGSKLSGQSRAHQGRAMIIILIVIGGLFTPILVSELFVEPYIQGNQYQYIWAPAYLPTISYTRWAYQVDDIQRYDKSVISAPVTGVQERVRLFTLSAARLNLKPQVGVNWMSIDEADVDIVYLNNREYWVSALTLVRPPYAGDVDVWRAEHLLLTHSERILGLDAVTTERVNMTNLLDLKTTPLMYYGEGGLWRDVDEIYLHIPGFQENHLPGYVGPSSYDDQPDYTYSGFWRWWKFFWMFRWDFAQGQYGDISSLTTRDAQTRLSTIVLKGMKLENDAYLAVGDDKNLYLIDWIWINYNSPSRYSDYPERVYDKIVRRFAVVTINLKNGVIEGYLVDKDRDDYILNFYRSFYEEWDKPMPGWLVNQLRYPEELLKTQIDVYNFYFQDNFQQWQNNQFYELTMQETTGGSLEPIEDIRYIVLPINGKLTWAAVRLVEWYKSPSRNLAGMYVAPSVQDINEVFFIDFGGATLIGPSVALSTLKNDPAIGSQLTLHPNWDHGNILMYSIGGVLYYIIPYYAIQSNLVLPVMVAVVNAESGKSGYYLIQDPNNSGEVGRAVSLALQGVGASLPTGLQISGRLEAKESYVVGGNTRWLLSIRMANGTSINALAKAEDLPQTAINKVISLKLGENVTVTMDQNYVISGIE